MAWPLVIHGVERLDLKFIGLGLDPTSYFVVATYITISSEWVSSLKISFIYGHGLGTNCK